MAALRPFDVLHVDAFLMRVLTQDASLREEDLPTARACRRGDDRERALVASPSTGERGARGGGSGDVRVSGPVVYGGGVAKKKENGAGAAARRSRSRSRTSDDRLEAASLIGVDGESPSVSSENTEWTRQLDDPDALASALDGLLSVCGDLLEVDGGANRAKRTRKALAKAVGKKVRGKQRGTRAEAAEAAGRGRERPTLEGVAVASHVRSYSTRRVG